MTERSTRPPSVLVVDDDDAVRRVVRDVLEAEGFEVDAAPDGPTALAALAQDTATLPDVVLLDVMMPGLDGVEVCRRIDHRRVRVVMLSARDDGDVRAKASEAGAAGYLVKPFSVHELVRAVLAGAAPPPPRA